MQNALRRIHAGRERARPQHDDIICVGRQLCLVRIFPDKGTYDRWFATSRRQCPCLDVDIPQGLSRLETRAFPSSAR